MSSECNQQCGGCETEHSECGKMDFREESHELSQVKKVIGVVSGKGGVGKTLVTSLLAASMQKLGYKTAVLDADITGPSVPKAFGIKEKAQGNELGIFPVRSKTGIEVMSINLLLENDSDPVVWRGPVIAGTVKQFWTDVIWGDVDFMFVDLPPGTGDVPLTVFQTLPIDGIVIVSTPQELVTMIVEKAVKMARMMDIPIVGIVENMSYVTCPDCDKKIYVFGESKLKETAQKFNIASMGSLSIDPIISQLCDRGEIELHKENLLGDIIETLKNIIENDGASKMKIAVTYANQNVYQHFGHTEQFKIYNIEDNKIVDANIVGTQGSGHGALAEVLKGYGVDTLICGGIGGGAKEALAMAGIKLYGGASGNADLIVEEFLRGELKYDSSVTCNHHSEGSGGHNCGSHGEGHSCGGGSCHS